MDSPRICRSCNLFCLQSPSRLRVLGFRNSSSKGEWGAWTCTPGPTFKFLSKWGSPVLDRCADAAYLLPCALVCVLGARGVFLVAGALAGETDSFKSGHTVYWVSDLHPLQCRRHSQSLQRMLRQQVQSYLEAALAGKSPALSRIHAFNSYI